MHPCGMLDGFASQYGNPLSGGFTSSHHTSPNLN